jgi:hypothetical protein
VDYFVRYILPPKENRIEIIIILLRVLLLFSQSSKPCSSDRHPKACLSDSWQTACMSTNPLSLLVHSRRLPPVIMMHSLITQNRLSGRKMRPPRVEPAPPAAQVRHHFSSLIDARVRVPTWYESADYEGTYINHYRKYTQRINLGTSSLSFLSFFFFFFCVSLGRPCPIPSSGPPLPPQTTVKSPERLLPLVPGASATLM